MDDASLLDFDKIRSLDYPPNHPLTLALEFTKAGAHENEVARCSEIIAGWIQDQRPAFAIKVILDNKKQDLFSDLCAFGKSAAATLEEPEAMLRTLESHFAVHADRSPDLNQYQLCQYRCCVCEGYAESEQLNHLPGWLSRINQQDSYDATVFRITNIFLRKWQLDKVQQWGQSLLGGSGEMVFWTMIARVRLARREVNEVGDLIDRKLGGESRAPLDIIGGFVALLVRADRRTEVEKWTASALERIRNEPGGDNVYLPFEIVCACKWLGRDHDVQYLWPRYERYAQNYTSLLAGKGCYGTAEDYYVHHFDLAETAGFSDLGNQVAAVYKEFMVNSNSPFKTVAAAREELAAMRRRRHACDGATAPLRPAKSSLDFAATNQKADALPERQRESLLCDLCYDNIQSQQWGHAIATLIKISRLPNPLNGPSYVREMARRICIGAGGAAVLTDGNLADLRQLLARLQRGEGG
jgi:hypothetical protein